MCNTILPNPPPPPNPRIGRGITEVHFFQSTTKHVRSDRRESSIKTWFSKTQHPWIREARLCDCACGTAMPYLCVKSSFSLQCVWVAKESSTGLVRVKACEMSRKSWQKQCVCGTCGSGSHLISKAGKGSTTSNHIPAVSSISTLMAQRSRTHSY
jgi:hypothetical protein